MTSENQKECFVISPIGDSGSEIRERSNLVLDHIISPAVEPLGYKAIRADEIDRPGLITSQVIQHVLDAPLVIADLTGHNPNVFYELAIRHVTGKPFVQIIQEGEAIPFDVGPMRTISVDHTHLARAAEARDNISAQIKSLEENPLDIETPISTSVDLQRLRQSDLPQEQLLADLLSRISDVQGEISALEEYMSSYDGRREIRRMAESMSAKIDESLSIALRSQGRYPSNLQNHVAQTRRSYEGTYEFLISISAFKDAAPWVYEIGVEVFRQFSSGNRDKARGLFQELVQLLNASVPVLRESGMPTLEEIIRGV